MKVFGFLATIADAFDGQRMSKGLASCALGLFLRGSPRTVYTNVVYPVKYDPHRLPITWALIVHYLHTRLITD